MGSAEALPTKRREDTLRRFARGVVSISFILTRSLATLTAIDFTGLRRLVYSCGARIWPAQAEANDA